MAMTGSDGEHTLQQQSGSTHRAARFYDRQMKDHLTESMQSFVMRQEMVFLATSDAKGNCDCSPRFGKPGFVHVINNRMLAIPEFRGNGVFANLGNILENPHIGLVFVDFLDSTVGLHVNGRATISLTHQIPFPVSPLENTYEIDETVRFIERWILIDIEEAYIHCSKHVPRLQKLDKSIHWGTDDPKAKTDNFFSQLPS
ncbi:MAG: pyridoxamine 5'-phosphate oxidase family protein [Nitrospirales bacterium]